MNRRIIASVLLCLGMITACSGLDVEEDYEYDESATAYYEGDLEETETESAQELTQEASSDSDINFGESSRTYLEAIAGDIGDREPGSDEEAQTAQYIEEVFSQIGYEPVIQDFTAEDEEEGGTIESSNVIAIKEGESDQVIVVGAHYDAAYEDGTNGADDNASGVAVMLEAAENVFNMDTPYTIEFVAFGAEELNLCGSTYFVENLSEDELENIVGMFNLDSLIAGDYIYVYGNEGDGSMRDWVLDDADEQNIEIEGKTDEDMLASDGSYCECSDNDAFEKSEIPYAYFEATNWEISSDGMVQVDMDYGVDGEIRHTEYDTIDYIDETFPGRIDEHLSDFSRLLYDFLTQYGAD